MDDNTLTLAHQAGIVPGRPVTAAQLAELVALARADERERIKAEPVQEPVAVVGTQVDVRRDQRIELEYVYTAPPKLVPLTDGALMGVYIDFDRTADPAWSGVEYLLRLCRAVERKLEEKNRGR